MVFNGNINSYVDLGDTYNNLSFPYTIEAWVKLYSFLPTTSVVFASDNGPFAYTGLILHIKSSGLVDFAFGNNTGGGPENRRDVISTTAVKLNQWTHVVGVAYSAFDMQIYINGEQSPTTTDGSATYIAGNSSHGSIGRRVDPNNTYSFDGEIDEVRLWNIARTQTDLRDFMCKKVDPNTSGLLGYWIADEFYSSSTILDNTFPAEDGYIVGNVEKTTSGAPLGHESHYIYTNDWTGKLLSLAAATGDKIGAKNITGNPHGVQMYLVNSEPYYTDSLNITPNYYFGVFCAESATAASYKVGYKYKYQNGIITAENEGLADVYTRMDGSVSEWHDLNANHDLSSNEFKKDNQISRGEYILNVEDGLRSAETSLFTSKGSINMISIFPNPAVNHITVDLTQVYEPIHSIRIIDLTGKIYYENKFIKNTKEFTADISTFSAGHYVVELITGSGRISGKFEVAR
jgi:hypothetical protein